MTLLMEKNILDQLLEETRQTKKQTDKLTQIDNAAIELFSEKGFSNTSTKEIAIKAQVAEGTIFKHYGTKENLLLNILLKFIKVLIPAIKKDMIHKLEKQNFSSAESFIQYFIKDRINFIQDNTEIFKVFIKEIVYNESLRKNLISLHFEDVKSMFFRYFDMFKEKGELAEIDNEIIIKLLLKIVLSEAIWLFALSDNYKSLDIEKLTMELTYEFLNGAGTNQVGGEQQ